MSGNHLLPEEKTAIDAAIKALQKALENKKRNLTPEERQRYGSVNESNKLFVNKVFDFSRTQQDTCSPDVDWKEFEVDHGDRAFYETRLIQLQGLMETMENNKILHDFDNFQNALMDYSTPISPSFRAQIFTFFSKNLQPFFAAARSMPPYFCIILFQEKVIQHHF